MMLKTLSIRDLRNTCEISELAYKMQEPGIMTKDEEGAAPISLNAAKEKLDEDCYGKVKKSWPSAPPVVMFLSVWRCAAAKETLIKAPPRSGGARKHCKTNSASGMLSR